MRLIMPDIYVKSVLELSPGRLAEWGIEALLLDVDCTLKQYLADSVSDDVRGWINELRAAGVGLCLVSNGLLGRIRRLAESLDLPYVSGACKPLPFGCLAAADKLGRGRSRTAMVGDQLLADILAARLAGIFSILVEPINPEQEPWFTRMKRPLERRLLKGFGDRG
jgi:uncharacterized protein